MFLSSHSHHHVVTVSSLLPFLGKAYISRRCDGAILRAHNQSCHAPVVVLGSRALQECKGGNCKKEDDAEANDQVAHLSLPDSVPITKDLYIKYHHAHHSRLLCPMQITVLLCLFLYKKKYKAGSCQSNRTQKT